MTQDLNEEIHDFNQQLLKQELSAALIIHKQFVAITDDLVANYRCEQTKELQKKILIVTEQCIKGMLQADSKEVFIMQQNRLTRLLANLKEKLALEGDFDLALEDYRFFHHLHLVLRDATLKTSKTRRDDLPVWFKKHSYYRNWQEKLERLAEQEKTVFESYKKELIEELLIKESYQDLANLASLALIEKNRRLLADIRLSYLEEATNRKKLFTDLAWMGLGVLLVAAATLFGLAFPLLLVPGFVIGAAVLGYGVIDFAKESVDRYSEIHDKQFGDRTASAEILVELQALEEPISEFDAEQFIAGQTLSAKQWSAEEKWITGAGYAASFAGFALAFAGFALLIPGVGIPVAAVLTVTVLAAVVTAFSALLIGVKIMQQRKQYQVLRQEIDMQIQDDNLILAQVDLAIVKTSESLKNSFTVILEKEQQANVLEVKKLALTPKQRREAFFHENEVDKDIEGEKKQQEEQDGNSEGGDVKAP